MRMISKTALAAALLVGAGGLVATAPANAKDKNQDKAQQAAPPLKLSDAFRKVAAPAQTALNAGDLATAETGITASEAAAKTDEERYLAAQLRLSLVAKQQQAAGGTDAAAMARSDAALAGPLETLINNPVTPKADLGRYSYLRGSIAFNEHKYADAVTYYGKAQAAGYQDPNMPLQIAKSKVESGDIAGGIAVLDTVIKQQEASGQKPSEDLYRYAVAKMYKTPDRAGTLAWVKRWLTAYPTPKNWRDAIIVFGFQGPTADQMGKPEKMDLYRLMAQTGALADERDFVAYGQLANQLGLPDEAKTVIEKGRSSGKIPTSDANATSIFKTAQASIANEGSLASLATKAASSAKGDLAEQTADAYLGQGNEAKAIELYKLALQKGIANTDRVNMHLGIAQAMSGDKASAASSFAAVQNAPTKDVATLWQTWVGAPAAGLAPAPAAAPAAAPVAAPQG